MCIFLKKKFPKLWEQGQSREWFNRSPRKVHCDLDIMTFDLWPSIIPRPCSVTLHGMTKICWDGYSLLGNLRTYCNICIPMQHCWGTDNNKLCQLTVGLPGNVEHTIKVNCLPSHSKYWMLFICNLLTLTNSQGVGGSSPNLHIFKLQWLTLVTVNYYRWQA